MGTLKLSAWRPVRSQQELHYSHVKSGSDHNSLITVGDEQSKSFSFSKNNLFEQIYSWSTREDVWGGICGEEIRVELKDLLFSSFSEGLSPAERGTSRMAHFLGKLSETIMQPGATDWMFCEQVNDEIGYETMPLRISPTVALFHHLSWVYETFHSVPSISFTVR